MDIVNTKIGQNITKESASVINEKTFDTSSMVGLSSGVSQFSKSENTHIIQQVKNAEKSLSHLADNGTLRSENKRKVISQNADDLFNEKSVNFSESLSDISELMQTNGTELSFSLEVNSESSADRPIIIVTDKQSGNVIRQIPSEEVLKFAERIKELESGSISSLGLVLDKQA